LDEAIKIILVILISSVKFVAGPPFATYFDTNVDFSYFETVAYCVIGGMLGVTAFSYFTRYIFMLWDYRKKVFYKVTGRKEVFTDPIVDIPDKVEVNYVYVDSSKKKNRIFTPRNRRIVKVWSKYGLAGIAFLTPIIISIPIGTVIATRLVHNKKKIFLYMFLSILFWSLTMNFIFEMASIKKPVPEHFSTPTTK
jgi:hypothetical protein